MAEFRQVLHIHIDKRINDYIQAKQNDTASRFLDCQLFNQYGVPYDLTRHKIKIVLTKPDGTKVFNDGKLTRSTDGMFCFELTTQSLSAVGIVQAEIKIKTEDERVTLTTKTFEIEVLKEIWDENAIESSNEYGAVVQLFQDVWEVSQSIFGIEKSVGTPQDELTNEEEPTSLTLFGGINKIRNYLFNLIVAAISGARDDVNNNVDNKFDILSKQINFVTPTYVSIDKSGTTNIPWSATVRTVDIPLHSGRGVLDRLQVTGTGQFAVATITIVTESGEFDSLTVRLDGDDNNILRTYGIYFKSYLGVRLYYRSTGNVASSNMSHRAVITIPTE